MHLGPWDEQRVSSPVDRSLCSGETDLEARRTGSLRDAHVGLPMRVGDYGDGSTRDLFHDVPPVDELAREQPVVESRQQVVAPRVEAEIEP